MIELIEWIRATITFGGVGIWTAVGMAVAWFVRERREDKKLTMADRQAKREGFTSQVTGLWAENRSLNHDLETLREIHDQFRADSHAKYDALRKHCDEETDGLRTQLIDLQNELTGVKRQMAASSAAAATIVRRAIEPDTDLLNRLDEP